MTAKPLEEQAEVEYNVQVNLNTQWQVQVQIDEMLNYNPKYWQWLLIYNTDSPCFINNMRYL